MGQERDINAYIMFHGNDELDINYQVQPKINGEGYVPFGHPTVVVVDGAVHIYQAVVRYSN